MALHSKIEAKGQDIVVTLSGVIDERATLPVFAEVSGHLFINLEQLTMINSIGCRSWVHWFKEVVRAKGGVSLIKCSPAIVHQINILSGFLPKGVRVDSFYVPYHCDECGHQDQILLVHGQDYNDERLLNEVTSRLCGACGALMSPDIIEKRYFQFLSKKAA